MPFSEIAKIGPPAPDELEVTIFGPSFGECVVVHFGSNRWFIVDSCVYSDIDGPVAAHYLTCLGLDLGAVVESILVTHWHDGHCKGISKLVEHCDRAAIWIPATLTDVEFIRFVKRLSKNKTLVGGVKTKEFSAILEELHRRKNAGSPNFGLASQRVTMHQSKGAQLAHGSDFKLVALSPSHGDGLDFLARVALQMPRAKRPKGSLGSPSPNDISVASLMEVGDAAILLGADLENGKASSGWNAVLNANRASAFGAKAAVYKIPHHGSKTAHNENVWTDTNSPSE
jgi:hypothetical protein